jgi:hypothetical protein
MTAAHFGYCTTGFTTSRVDRRGSVSFHLQAASGTRFTNHGKMLNQNVRIGGSDRHRRLTALGPCHRCMSTLLF